MTCAQQEEQIEYKISIKKKTIKISTEIHIKMKTEIQ